MAKMKCPECDLPMEARPYTIKWEGSQEKKGTAYVCHKCKGAFIPKSIFGVGP